MKQTHFKQTFIPDWSQGFQNRTGGLNKQTMKFLLTLWKPKLVMSWS